jgi:hypothetical protein
LFVVWLLLSVARGKDSYQRHWTEGRFEFAEDKVSKLKSFACVD